MTNQEARKDKRSAALSSVIAAIGLTAFKLIVGLLTNSLGILAEAAHSGLDLVAAFITLLAVGASDKPADRDHPYGHGKIENFSALAETVLLFVTCAWIIYEAIRRLFVQTIEVDPSLWAFLVMALGAQPHFLGRMLPIAFPDRAVMLLPFLNNVRAPSRFVVYVYLFWSIVVVLSLDWILRTSKTRRKSIILAVSIVGLLLLDYSFICDKITAVPVPACYEMMERGGERYGVLDLPSGYAEVDRYMMYQSFHRLPIVQGWASRKIGKSLIDRLEWNDLKLQEQQLIESKVKYIVIHKEYLPNDSVRVDLYRKHYSPCFEDQNNLVFQVYWPRAAGRQ